MSEYGAFRCGSQDPNGMDLVAVLSAQAQITMGSSPRNELNETGKGAVFHQGFEISEFAIRPIEWTTAPVRYAEAKDCLVSVRAPVGELNLAAEKT